MAECGVEVDEVGKQQPAVTKTTPPLEHTIEESIVSVASLVPPGAAMRKDIIDFADRDDIAAFTLGNVQDCRLGGRHSKIAPVRSSPEVTAAGSEEWSSDHTADV